MSRVTEFQVPSSQFHAKNWKRFLLQDCCISSTSIMHINLIKITVLEFPLILMWLSLINQKNAVVLWPVQRRQNRILNQRYTLASGFASSALEDASHQEKKKVLRQERKKLKTAATWQTKHWKDRKWGTEWQLGGACQCRQKRVSVGWSTAGDKR